MKAEDVLSVRNRMQPLLNQQLQSIFRFEGLLCLQFGKLIESEAHSPRHLHKDESGKVTAKKVLVGELRLHIASAYRIICGDEIVLARGDRFYPSTGIEKRAKAEGRAPNWDTDKFDKIGHNKLDETIGLRFRELAGFVVEAVEVNSFGDLRIKFANDFVLEAYSDCSQHDDECWRFWREGDDDHLVITGTGIEPPEEKHEEE
ncbi:MAG: hypothetical protein LBD04_04890 [Synergistaceae bacterium]|jgi:hypothetical protein|nr:hypothetical protein [Synergistaceae bacterium]